MGVQTIIDELNRLYAFDIDKYLKECDDLKRMGYKIYRNDSGQHKVVEPQRGVPKYNPYGRPVDNPLKDLFGDIFGGLF